MCPYNSLFESTSRSGCCGAVFPPGFRPHITRLNQVSNTALQALMDYLHWGITMDISIAQVPPYSYEHNFDFLSRHSQASGQNRNADPMQPFHHILFRQLGSSDIRSC